ncbi:MAG TPA: hypothetical protein VGE88_07025 [Lysobacter sp.]
MTIAALGALAVGAGMQYKANKDRQADMRRVQRRETERQDKFYQEAATEQAQNRDSYTRENVEQKMADAAGEREAQYALAEAVAPRANETPVGAQGGNQVIADAFTRALSDAKAQSTQQGALRAKLASFGDALGENAIENNRRTGRIGMVGSFSQGSANVMPLELQHEATRERSTETIGSLLQAFGGAMLGGGAGLGGAAAGAAAGGASAPVNWSSLFTSGRTPNLG